MRIALDLDEVLAGLLEAMLEFHNQRFHTSYTFQQFTSYDWWETWNLSKEETTEEFYEFIREHSVDKIQPIPGAHKALEYLSGQGHEFFIVTSRQSDLQEYTAAWISRFFPMLRDRIHTSNRYGTGKRFTKSEICRSIGAECIVEDQLIYARDCAKHGIPALLLDRPWNQADDIPSISRLPSWESVVKHLERN